jgi:hypothetical protein
MLIAIELPFNDRGFQSPEPALAPYRGAEEVRPWTIAPRVSPR